jgi:hypothetical protein
MSEEKKQSGPRNAGVILSGLEDGQLMIDLGVEFQRLGQQLMRIADHEGKAKGTLSLSLGMSAERGGVVTVHAAINVKEPKMARESSIRWLLPDGNLSASNPRQTLLPLKEVSAPRAAAPSHDEETGELRG